MKMKYRDNIELCYQDAYSYIYDIRTDDVYKDMKVVTGKFDTRYYTKYNI